MTRDFWSEEFDSQVVVGFQAFAVVLSGPLISAAVFGDILETASTVRPSQLDAVMTPLTRITHDPEKMGGKPCIRGLRITVGTIDGLVGERPHDSRNPRRVPYLEPADIQEALVRSRLNSRETVDAISSGTDSAGCDSVG